MFRNFTLFFGLLLALFSGNSLQAFSLNGPNELPWEVQLNGYIDNRLSGPMNIDAEYRWNVPVITYGFDSAFISYFGTNGIKSVEQAIEILNNLPKSSEMNLDDFPFESQRVNPKAQALSLLDLKSHALNRMMFELGLIEPERYVHTVRDHHDYPNSDFDAYVIQRNYDPVTLTPTSYINGQLWTYDTIFHSLSPIHTTFPVNHPVDPFVAPSTVTGGIFDFGYFFNGLTYDDVGGLKYLLATNNLNLEPLLPGIFVIYTNTLDPKSLETQDLALLTQRAQRTTNDVVTLLSFPGYTNLHIISTNTYLTNLITTNISSYFTNYPYALDTAPEQVFTTNYVTNVTLGFDYGFDNVVTNTVYTRMVVTQQVDVLPSVTYQPGLGGLITNITYLGTNYEVGGDFYILPINNIPVPGGQINANVGIDLISTQSMSAVTTTNRIFPVVSEFVAVTNTNAIPLQLNTLDLGTLYQQAHWTTNDPDQLLSLYTNLLITATNSHHITNIVTNIFTYFTNFPSLIPPGPLQVYITNYTTNSVLVYDYSFGNVVINGSTNHFTSFTGWEDNFPANPPAYINGINLFPNITWQTALIRKLELVPQPTYSPGQGVIQTNVLDAYTDFIPIPTGDFFIVPTNILGFSKNYLIQTGTATTTNIGIYETALLMTNQSKLTVDLSTLDLTAFMEQARTNSPAELLAIPDYQDLLITTVSNYFTNVTITNFVRTFVTNDANAPYACATCGPLLEVTNYFVTNVLETNWVYTFGNVVTNTFYTAGLVTSGGSLTTFDSWAVAGSPPVTEDIPTVTYTSNYINGTIFIVPTNLIGYVIVESATNVVPVTNLLSANTNFFQSTNVDETFVVRYFTNYSYGAHEVELLTTNDFATNDFGIRREITWTIRTNVYDVFPIQLVTTNDLASNGFSRVDVVSYYTNMTLGYYNVTLENDTNANLRPGVDKLTFARMYNMTTISTNFYPFTTNYIDQYYVTEGTTNSVLKTRVVTRTVYRPDILFTASDSGVDSGHRPIFPGWTTGAAGWQNNGLLHGGNTGAGLPFPGPGLIPGDNLANNDSPITIQFTKAGPTTINQSLTINSNSFLRQAYLGQRLNGEQVTYAWASFDGSTNQPVIYPVGSSFTELENQVLGPQSP